MKTLILLISIITIVGYGCKKNENFSAYTIDHIDAGIYQYGSEFVFHDTLGISFTNLAMHDTETMYIDLNNDSIMDFELNINGNMSPGGLHTGRIWVESIDSNLYFVSTQNYDKYIRYLNGSTVMQEAFDSSANYGSNVTILNYNYTSPLRMEVNDRINFSMDFSNDKLEFSYFDYTSNLTIMSNIRFGNWLGYGEHYIGFKWYLNNKIYLGWIRLEIPFSYNMRLLEYAYIETK